MRLFGITGPIGHGKTTLANALIALETPSLHIEPSDIIAEVANEWFATFPKDLLVDPLDYGLLNRWLDDLARVVSHQIKPTTGNQLHITHDQVLGESKYYYKLFMHFNLIRQGVIPLGKAIVIDNKDKHRTILQWIGGFLVHRVDSGIWFDHIERLITQARQNGTKLVVVGGVRYPYDASVIRQNRGILIKLVRADLPERELADITEEHRREITVDTTVISDARPEALPELVKALYQDLLVGDLLKEYNSNDFLGLAE
ncbi:MAG TPA: hypothetical protein VGA08_00505 [Candidatus Saccharimonadales bacterium]